MASEMSAWDQHKIFDRYIDALLSLSSDSATRTSWLEQANAFTRAFSENTDLARAFADPRINVAKKEAVMLDLGTAMQFDTALTRTLAVFLRQGRGGTMPAFIKHLSTRLKREMGVLSADVTSATELTAAQQASLAQSLGNNVELNTSVDPSLLGGLIVQIGSWRKRQAGTPDTPFEIRRVTLYLHT